MVASGLPAVCRVFCKSLYCCIGKEKLTALVVWFGASEHFHLETIMHYGHIFEFAAITLVAFVILLPNIIHMWWFTVYKTGNKAPISAYFKAIGELIVHMFTQKRTLGCDDNQIRWLEHFILVLGYLSLLFTTVFLNWFETHSMFIIILGYVESAVIFVVTFDFIRRRIIKIRKSVSTLNPAIGFLSSGCF